MKVLIYKKENSEIAFKFEGDDAEYNFDQNGMFKYIDLIIAEKYLKIDIDYDEEDKTLKPYADLFDEIYEEVVKPENKFKETYDKYVENSEKQENSDRAVDDILKDKNN